MDDIARLHRRDRGAQPELATGYLGNRNAEQQAETDFYKDATTPKRAPSPRDLLKSQALQLRFLVEQETGEARRCLERAEQAAKRAVEFEEAANRL